MVRVLLAEDDAAISDPLCRALMREGHEVDVRTDGESALDGALNGSPDVVLLDIGLPRLDGLEVCRKLREAGSSVPVVFLTARAEEVDMIVGLDAGADDYVTKPFRMAELSARMRAALRRSPNEAAAAAGVVPGAPAVAPAATPAAAAEDLVRIDVPARRAWCRGQEMQLSAKEFDLLRVLLRSRGVVVTRESLMREIWDTQWLGSTKTLDMHVSSLRRKLGDDATSPRYISTVRGVGFRFERLE